MHVIVMPSVDVENGMVVKRVEGLRGTGLVIGDARSVVHELYERGFEYIHIVDLDGAEKGRPVNSEVACYAARLGMRVEFGGGLRRRRDIELLDACGVERFVLGTLPLRDPSLARSLLWEFGVERFVAALDARHGVVLAEGWRRQVDSITRVLELLLEEGFKNILYTCVECEGRLAGVNTEAVSVIRGRWPGRLGYAGGISSREDIAVLAELGVDFAVLGMCHYMRILDAGDASVIAWRV